MLPKRIAVPIVLLALGGCATKGADSPLARQCTAALELAADEIKAARDMNDQGTLDVMRASTLHSQATVAKSFGKYESCIEKANRARSAVRAAYSSKPRP